jgi:FkbM family methyltransferase
MKIRRQVRRPVRQVGARMVGMASRLLLTPEEKRARRWAHAGHDRTLRLQYPLTTNAIVFDLGGYQGQWASDIYSMYRCRIHVFEPVAAFAEMIVARFAKNPDVIVHDFGLASSTRASIVTLGRDASSMMRDDLDGPKEEIRLVAFSDFIKAEGIANIDLMKVNIEGGEYDLLNHVLDAGLIDMIADLQVQFHSFVEGAEQRMLDLRGRLAHTHEPTYAVDFVWENWRRLSR